MATILAEPTDLVLTPPEPVVTIAPDKASGLVPLDEIVFQGQCFHFIVDDNELDIRDFSPQVVELEIGVARILKITPDSASQ